MPYLCKYEGDYLIGGGFDGSVRIYDQQLREMHSLQGHKGGISCLSALKGHALITGGHDGALNVFRVVP